MIRIVTDSTCDLPQSIVDQLHIAVIPLYINLGDRGYLDGVEITREAFYRDLPDYDPFPTTAVPSLDTFRQAYERLARQGATEVLSIHISESLSGTVNVARAAADQTDAVPVRVLDSQQLSLGTGFLVERAARLALEGAPMQQILAALEEQITRTHVFAALDTLEFLRRSGRMNGVVAGIGGLLQVKPLLKMHRGNPTSERVRTSNGAFKRLVNMLEEKRPLERVALVHTHAPERAQALLQATTVSHPEEQVLSVDITPVIGAHIGPEAVGFACVSSP